MSEKLDKIEWAVDCLKSRMDAEERVRADGLNAEALLEKHYAWHKEQGTKSKPVYALVHKKNGKMETWSLSKNDIERKRMAQWEPEEWDVVKK